VEVDRGREVQRITVSGCYSDRRSSLNSQVLRACQRQVLAGLRKARGALVSAGHV